MRPASAPRDDELDTKLLHLDPVTHAIVDETMRDLPKHFRKGDLLVLNDAATLPASLFARTAARAQIELRLLGEIGPSRFRAVLLGEGDYRTPTEHRAKPPELHAGDRIFFGDDLGATVRTLDPLSTRLLELELDVHGDAVWNELLARGRAVQYAHVPLPLDLWSVQTPYATRPWASEMPSAGRPLKFALLLALRRLGVTIRTLTHAAGLSATGDPAIDAALPLPERYDIPKETVKAIADAKSSNGRIVAVGTSVVRALEGCAATHGGRVVAGEGVTDLRIDRAFRRRIVDGLLTGVHDPTTSHFDLLRAFASEDDLTRANEHAVRAGYLGHELGDVSLILPA